jgi:hypothetical protein
MNKIADFILGIVFCNYVAVICGLGLTIIITEELELDNKFTIIFDMLYEFLLLSNFCIFIIYLLAKYLNKVK